MCYCFLMISRYFIRNLRSSWCAMRLSTSIRPCASIRVITVQYDRWVDAVKSLISRRCNGHGASKWAKFSVHITILKARQTNGKLTVFADAISDVVISVRQILEGVILIPNRRMKHEGVNYFSTGVWLNKVPIREFIWWRYVQEFKNRNTVTQSRGKLNWTN